MNTVAIHTFHSEEIVPNDQARLSGNSNLNLNTGLNVDNNLFDGLGGSVKAIAKKIRLAIGLMARMDVVSAMWTTLQQGNTHSIKRLWMRIS